MSDRDPPSVPPESFRTLLGRFASGVTVVTALDHAGHPHGMTVSAFASVSLDPPLVLACIDKAASMSAVLLDNTAFAVNILAEGQHDWSQRFADAAMELRFEGIPWHPGGSGAPFIDGAHANLACVPWSTVDAGDHVILVGRVVGGSARPGSRPLLYHQGTYGALG